MANYNSKASQILNGTANFLNGVANAGKDLIVNPVVDLGALAAKGVNIGLDKLTGENLAPEANKKIDKAADQITGRADMNGLIKNTSNPVDPTSLAYAAGEGLTRGVDQAAAVISLAEAARQLPKVAQAGWKKILNKVKDAKSKKQQMELAKEAREYIDMNSNFNAQDIWSRSDVPAYQQRRNAEVYNMYAKPSTEGVMESYRGTYMPNNGEMKTYANVTDDLADGSKSLRDVQKKMDPDGEALIEAYNKGYPKRVLNDLTTPRPVNASTTSDVNGLKWQQYRKWTYGDRLKASNQKFLDAAPTPRSKAIRTDEVKRANDLGMTAEQLRNEAKKYGGSTQWYYEQRKALDKLGVNNFEDYAKTMGLDGGTPNIYNVKEYNKIKNSGAKVVRDPSNDIVDSSMYNPRDPNIDIDRLDSLARQAGYKDYEDAYTKWANNGYGFVSPEEMIKEAITLNEEAAADAASQVASARAESWPIAL